MLSNQIHSLSASQRFQVQTHYDVLHHQKRVDYLSHRKLGALGKMLLEQSQEAIKRPGSAYNSVDLHNQSLLEELDQFAKENDCESVEALLDRI